MHYLLLSKSKSMLYNRVFALLVTNLAKYATIFLHAKYCKYFIIPSYLLSPLITSKRNPNTAELIYHTFNTQL